MNDSCFSVVRALGAALVMMAVADPGWAQKPNLVNNGSFDSTVDGWSFHIRSCPIFVWDPMDISSDPSSGSAALMERCGPPPIPLVEAAVVSNCVDTAGIDGLIVSGSLFHDGDWWSDRVYVELLVYSDTLCSTTETLIPIGEDDGSATWLTFSEVVDLLQGIGFQVNSARISFRQVVACCKYSYFDNASLIPVEVFSDAFEEGDTSVWSSSVP